MKTLWLVLLGCCSTTVGGSFIFPGQHPNYDAQFWGEAIVAYPDSAILLGQFPQNNFVYQPPLLGYLSPVNPAKLIVWTTVRDPNDRFEAALLDGEPGPLFPEPPTGPPPPPTGNPGGEIPEPSPGLLTIAGLTCAALMNRAAARRPLQVRR